MGRGETSEQRSEITERERRDFRTEIKNHRERETLGSMYFSRFRIRASLYTFKPFRVVSPEIEYVHEILEFE
jgi:hypothetical protein